MHILIFWTVFIYWISGSDFYFLDLRTLDKIFFSSDRNYFLTDGKDF